MAAKKSNAVFRRSKVSPDDVDLQSWDDFAVINAYDSAVSDENKQMNDLASGVLTEETASHQQDTEWLPGMPCMALFEEDGLYYPGVIKSVDQVSAVVVFDDYLDDEEVIDLNNVHRPELWLQTDHQQMEADKSKKTAEKHLLPLKKCKQKSKKCKKSNTVKFPSPPMISPHLQPADPNNKEELSHMLTSWYMAGYHTGYYRGVSMKNNTNHNFTKSKK